jgi:hypothetical protein
VPQFRKDADEGAGRRPESRAAPDVIKGVGLAADIKNSDQSSALIGVISPRAVSANSIANNKTNLLL